MCPGKIPSEWWIFQPAMLDSWRVTRGRWRWIFPKNNQAVNKATKNLEKSQAGSTSGWLPKPNQLLEAWQFLCQGHKENGGNVGMGAP